jgi:hypothetical protein
MNPNAYTDRSIPGWPTNDPGYLQGVDWPTALSPNAPINTEEVYRLLWQYGVRVLWQSATKCPCRAREGDSSPRRGCPVCHGTGWFFHHPQIIRAASLGIRRELKPYEIPGEWSEGSLNMTARAETCPANRDRVTLLDARIPMSSLLTREAAVGELEPLKWPIAKKTIDMADTTSRTLDVLQILPMDANGNARVDGFGNPYPLVRGTEYEIVYSDFAPELEAVAASADPPSGYVAQQIGKIDWALGDAMATPPCPVGRPFAITYQTMPVYEVTSFPHSVRDTRTNLKLQEERNLPLPVQFKVDLELFRGRDG